MFTHTMLYCHKYAVIFLCEFFQGFQYIFHDYGILFFSKDKLIYTDNDQRFWVWVDRKGPRWSAGG